MKAKFTYLLHDCCLLPFVICMVMSQIFGGFTAVGDAKELLDKYKDGSYYLSNHGVFSEVTEVQYYTMYVLQIMAVAFFILNIAICFIRLYKKRKCSFCKSN